MSYRIGERSTLTFEQWIEHGQAANADVSAADPIVLRRVMMTRSKIAPRLTGTSQGLHWPNPATLMLTTVAPCPVVRPNPADFWAVEVDVVLWGPAEPYQVEVELAALFEVQPCTVPRDQLLDQLASEGSRRLHQMARQHVLQSTVYGPWGPCEIGPLAPRRMHGATDIDLEPVARAIGYWVARQCKDDPHELLEVEHLFSALALSGDTARAAVELADLLGYVTYDEEEGDCSPGWPAD